MEKIRIFLSYKHEFKEAATNIARILRGRGGRGLELFLAEELVSGADWFGEIKKALDCSDLLLLLLTDPSAKWDWCLYEAGLFTDLKNEAGKRVICLHPHNSERPPQLKHLQAVEVNPTGVAKFLRELFGETALTRQSEPLNKDFADDPESLKQEAERICQLFNPPGKHVWQYYTKYFELHVDDLASIRQDNLPDKAVVTSANQETFTLFGLLWQSEGWQWGPFKSAASEACEDDRWIDELTHAAYAASQHRTIPQVQATFRARDGNIYHPILSRCDKYPPGTITFHVLLMETVVGGLGSIRPDLGILVTGLRAGLRLKYEVSPYVEKLEESGDDDKRKEICQLIEKTIGNIDNEVKSRGAREASRGGKIEKDYFVSTFVDPHERNEAGELYDRLREARKNLRRELESIDVEKVLARLRQVEKLSGELMVLASKRYNELICELAAS